MLCQVTPTQLPHEDKSLSLRNTMHQHSCIGITCTVYSKAGPFWNLLFILLLIVQYFCPTAERERSFEVINKAAEIFNNRTCLKWLPYTPELAEKVGHNHYVEFRDSRYVNVGSKGGGGLNHKKVSALLLCLYYVYLSKRGVGHWPLPPMSNLMSNFNVVS